MMCIVKNLRNHSYRGFSMIELLIVVAVVGIIATVAIPSYNRYILKSRRSEAMINLIKFQAAYEEFNTQNNTYPASDTLPPAVVPPIPATTYYTYTSTTTSTSYTITATAIGSQANDAEGAIACSPMSINNIGTQTPAACWTQ